MKIKVDFLSIFLCSSLMFFVNLNGVLGKGNIETYDLLIKNAQVFDGELSDLSR